MRRNTTGGERAAKRRKLLFLVAEDWYFCSHRLPLAVAARAAGYEVAVATRLGSRGPLIEAAGIRVIPLRRLRRSSLNPFRELQVLAELWRIYRQERPDLVHQVALKPVVYGSLVARWAGRPAVVNALGGLGFVFSSRRRLAQVLQPLFVALFRRILNAAGSRLILQNQEDLRTVTERAGVAATQVRLIRSAGVDLAHYAVRPLPEGTPIVMLASRLLWDKGVGQFVEAAAALTKEGIAARFVLVGEPDEENPSSVPRAQVQAWHDSGCIEWWGYRDDMPAVLASATVVCLPSFYGEGIPKVLIEAMACARCIVTTDMPGCRDLVRGSENGMLVPPRDAGALADVLRMLLRDHASCERMGRAGRQIAEAEYALPRIVGETLAVYRELLPE